MKILFLTEFYPTTLAADVRGGVEQRTLRLSQFLGNQHEVTVVAGREPGTPPSARLGQVDVQRPGPTTVYRQGGGLLARLRYAQAARQVVLRSEADVMFVENFLGYGIMLTVSDTLRRRCFITYHDVWVGEWVKHVGFVSGVLGEIVERLTLRRQWLRWLANSSVTKEKLIHYGVARDQIDLVYNGIDLAVYKAVAPEKFAQSTIVAVARLVKYKKLDDLLFAFQIVHQKFSSARLVMIGSGPEEIALKNLTEKLGLSSVVDWRGFVPRHEDVLAAIKGATVFSLPSAVEGFGIVTAEAMACGTPFVSSDIPPTREVCEGQGGLLYSLGDRQALANGLLKYLENSAEAQAIGQQGLQRVARFDWAEIEEQLGQIVQKYA